MVEKYEVLQAHCAALGRPYASVLRTYHFVPTLLADSSAGLTVKRERAAQLLAFAGAGALVGAPEQAVECVQPLVRAGCQYFTFAVFDPDTLRLLAERVVPPWSELRQQPSIRALAHQTSTVRWTAGFSGLTT